MIKLNKLRYFDVSLMYSRASWGVLVCLGVSWGNKTDRCEAISGFRWTIFETLIETIFSCFVRDLG